MSKVKEAPDLGQRYWQRGVPENLPVILLNVGIVKVHDVGFLRMVICEFDEPNEGVHGLILVTLQSADEITDLGERYNNFILRGKISSETRDFGLSFPVRPFSGTIEPMPDAEDGQ